MNNQLYRKRFLLAGIIFLSGLFFALYLSGCENPNQPVTGQPGDVTGSSTGEASKVVGHVRDREGNPVAAAGVAVTKGTAPVPEMLVVTEADGSYTWALPPGTFTLTVTKDGYQPVSMEAVVQVDQVTTVDFVLQ